MLTQVVLWLSIYLQDSYNKDFGAGLKPRAAADFSTDDMILEKVKPRAKVMA